jgi:hypothetical protein
VSRAGGIPVVHGGEDVNGNMMDRYLAWLESTTPAQRLGVSRNDTRGAEQWVDADGQPCTPGCPDDVCRSEGTCAWSGV